MRPLRFASAGSARLHIRQRLPAFIGLAALLCAAAVHAAGTAPSDHFDLHHWKLTVPVDRAGGNRGPATEIQPRDLAGYSSPWFSMGAGGRTLEFWAPVNGATTSGSHYPRSELRETLNPDNDNITWMLATRSILRAKCKVLQVPESTGKVVVGQIHGFQTKPLVKLVYAYKASRTSGSLYALIDPTPTATSSVKMMLASKVSLQQAFEYKIEIRHQNGKPLLWMQVDQSPAAVYTIDPAWYSIGLYFKAGVYVQASGSSDTDGGRVAFYRLTATHPNNGLAVSTSSLSPARAYEWYSQRLSSSGGIGPAVWSVVSGVLPDGFALSSDGVLSGIPAAVLSSVTWYFSLLASDQQGDTAARNYALTIQPNP